MYVGVWMYVCMDVCMYAMCVCVYVCDVCDVCHVCEVCMCVCMTRVHLAGV